MKNLRSLFVLAISICFLVIFVTQVWSSEQSKIQKQPSQLLNIGPTQQKETIFLCSVSGTVKLDPIASDLPNLIPGLFYYRGPVTFKAHKDLESTNVYFKGKHYTCSCPTCPGHLPDYTEVNPEVNFKANESKTYNISCISPESCRR